jgi:integrase
VLHQSKLMKYPRGRHSDGKNLYVIISRPGVGSFMYRSNKYQEGLGSIDVVTVTEAREKAAAIRKLEHEGKDPKVERENARLDQEIAKGLAKTFGEVADEYSNAYVKHTSSSWKEQVLWLRRVYLDKISHITIQKIDLNIHILDDAYVGFNKLWTDKHGTAKALRILLNGIFEFAVAKGYRGDSPVASVRLRRLLRRSRDVHTVTHRASLPYQTIPLFMATLRTWKDPSKRQYGHTIMALLIEMIVLTGVRMSEARLAEWREFDLENMIWTVPWQHLKMGKFHKKDRPVPITPQMLAVLQQMREKSIDQSPTALVFPSPYGGPYNRTSCVNFLDKTLKWTPKITTHGFRSTLRDWCRVNKHDDLLWKIQADHASGDKSDQAYGTQSAVFEQRRQMMTAYGKFCDRPTPAAGTNVAQINEARKRRRAS